MAAAAGATTVFGGAGSGRRLAFHLARLDELLLLGLVLVIELENAGLCVRGQGQIAKGKRLGNRAMSVDLNA